jgi:hypothetical protein
VGVCNVSPARYLSRIGVTCTCTLFSEGDPVGFKNLLFTASIASGVTLVGIFEAGLEGVELSREGETASSSEVEVECLELSSKMGSEGEDRVEALGRGTEATSGGTVRSWFVSIADWLRRMPSTCSSSSIVELPFRAFGGVEIEVRFS